MRFFNSDNRNAVVVAAVGVAGFASQCVLATNATNAANTRNNSDNEVGWELLGLAPVILIAVGFGVAAIYKRCCSNRLPSHLTEEGLHPDYGIN